MQPRGRFVGLVVAVLVCTSLLGGAGAASAAGSCLDAPLVPKHGNQARVAAAVVCLINDHRAAHGLEPLKPNKKLRWAATRHSRKMVAREFFSHIDPDGKTPLVRIAAADYLNLTD